MTLWWVSWCHNVSHPLTSWQLISHAFLISQTPKNFGTSKLDTDVSKGSQLNPKKTLCGGIWLYSFSLPRLAAATKSADLLFLLLQDGRHQQTEKLQNLIHKIDCGVYCSSIKVTCDFQYSLYLPEVLPLGNLGHLTTFYPFLTTFPGSRVWISLFFSFLGLVSLSTCACNSNNLVFTRQTLNR